MANISINNNISTTTVDALTDEQVDVIVGGELAVGWDDEIRLSTGSDDNREWLELYCARHESKYGVPLVIDCVPLAGD